jgi:hypothetical protein
MHILSVHLDDQTDSLLRAICARTGQTQSDAAKAGIAALGRRGLRDRAGNHSNSSR